MVYRSRSRDAQPSYCDQCVVCSVQQERRCLGCHERVLLKKVKCVRCGEQKAGASIVADLVESRSLSVVTDGVTAWSLCAKQEC